MAVMVSVSRVIPENPAVIARVDPVIDIRQVVPDDPIPLVDPDLPSQYPTALCAGQVRPLIDGFSNTASHDLAYHGWQTVGALDIAPFCPRA